MKKLQKRFRMAKDTVEAMAGMCDYGCNCELGGCICNDLEDYMSSYNETMWQYNSMKNIAYKAEIA